MHAIPVIKPIRNPYGQEHQPVEVTIISCRSRLRMLKHIAPEFGRIWNGRQLVDQTLNSPIDVSGRSFLHVRVWEQKPLIDADFPQLQSSSDDIHQRPLNIMELPQDWSLTIQRIVSRESAARPAAILVCGPKGSGKSTFCRFLANALCTISFTQRHAETLSPAKTGVMLLDLDPGQPEFSPPGEVSLLQVHSCNFGAPFTHPILPSTAGSRLLRAHHVGCLSPRDDPQHYLNCATDLSQLYTELARTMAVSPLIVNCSGWIQGSGIDLLAALIGHIPLTDVFYTSKSGPEEVVDALGQACSSKNLSLQQLTSQPSPSPAKTASELRMMQTLSYFHLSDPEYGNLRWDPSPLTDRPPLVVHYAGPSQAIFAVTILGDAINVEYFDCVLEGCVVGIVVLDDDSAIPASAAHASKGALNSSDEDEELSMSPNGIMDEDLSSIDNRPQISTGDDASIEFPPTSLDTPSHVAVREEKLTQTPYHLDREVVRRTPTGIPYLAPVNHTTTPLLPTASHSLGQALIRSISPKTKTFHLLTPIPSSTLQSLHEQKRKIVLVRGKLDAPTWAYKEDLELEKSRRKRREKELGVQAENGADDARGWAKKQPWASVVEGGRKGSARARRVRRDLRYKGQGGVEMTG